MGAERHRPAIVGGGVGQGLYHLLRGRARLSLHTLQRGRIAIPSIEPIVQHPKATKKGNPVP